ncbi:MAG: putative beta-lysine N-acetyltransferase [Acidobacteria bacterium]|nr:putative beta-lysine N-acetyltransferase [Acidobacteriota bacterium]
MSDIIETFGRSRIQHGDYNDRIYLMKLHADDVPGIVPDLIGLAREKGYSKIFAKIPASARAVFLEHDFREEASIPRFYKGQEDACFMGRFLSEERSRESRPELVQKVLETARQKEVLTEIASPGNDFRMREATENDLRGMAAVFREVFPTYPFPIHDPEYLRRTMASHIRYFVVERGGEIIAVSSAETDPDNLNVEMTDFATLPHYRGHGLALHLLALMEEEMHREGFITAYTIARSYSYGMNITFTKLGYEYSGTLTHNTNISGALESMNIWYKPLAEYGHR